MDGPMFVDCTFLNEPKDAHGFVVDDYSLSNTHGHGATVRRTAVHEEYVYVPNADEPVIVKEVEDK